MSILPASYCTRTAGPSARRVFCRDRTGRKPISIPYVNFNDEAIGDLAGQIASRLADKGQKRYPGNTVLIINCITDGVVLEDEWNDAIARVAAMNLHRMFREVFLIEHV